MSFDNDDMFSALDTKVASPAPAASAYSPPVAPMSPAPHSPSPVASHSSHYDSPLKTSSASSLVDQKSAFQLQWESEQAKRLDEQKKREDQKRKENIAQAQKQVKQFYAEREEKKKVAFQNLKATEHGPTGAKGASWSNVSGLVDLSEKGRKNEKDTTKLKSILIEMKQQK